MDYICTPSCNVTFATGEITEMFDITIINSNTFEGLEHFSVTFTTPGSYIIIGNPSEAVILIVDIDGKCMPKHTITTRRCKYKCFTVND